jgi:hypothetical protein
LRTAGCLAVEASLHRWGSEYLPDTKVPAVRGTLARLTGNLIGVSLHIY